MNWLHNRASIYKKKKQWERALWQEITHIFHLFHYKIFRENPVTFVFIQVEFMAKFFFHPTWHAIEREPEASFSCFIKNKGPEKTISMKKRNTTIYTVFKEWGHGLTKEGNINISLNQKVKCKNLLSKNSKALNKIFDIKCYHFLQYKK